MVERCTGEHHGIIIRPLGRVAPATPTLVPVVAPRRVTNYSVREIPPHREGKINLAINK